MATQSKTKLWLWCIIFILATLTATVILLLIIGAMRDPTQSLHGMLGSALWTTFGPHLVLLSGAALLLLTTSYRYFKGHIPVMAILLSLAATLGSVYITTCILAATYQAGGSANPITGLRLSSMTDSAPDESVIFTHAQGKALTAAIYKPAPTGNKAPVILYIHGGGFMIGSNVETAADLRWFADRGWLVFSVDYRLWTTDNPTWDKAPEDVACAAAWVQTYAATYGGDIEQLAILGDSAGGNLAINFSYAAALGKIQSGCGTVIPVPKAVVVQYPAVDPLAIYEQGYPVAGFEPKMLMTGYIGGDPYQLPERVQAISAYTYISEKAPPTLIIAPEKDGLVPSWSVYRFADQARLAGADIELVRIPFASHVYNQIAFNSIGNQARLSITESYLLDKIKKDLSNNRRLKINHE